MNINYSPVATSNASGMFNTTSAGYVQGTAQENPSARNQLTSGPIATDETLPWWGGMGVYENIPGGITGGPSENLGGVVGRATSLTAAAAKSMVGFSVFDQAYNMIQTPNSEVPIALPGMTGHLYRFGSLARVVVQCDPALVSLDNSIITSQVSWDFGGQKLIKGQAGWAANTITAATWANTAGGQSTFTTNTAHGVGVGEYVNISGVLPAGFNGNWLTIAGTTGSTIVTTGPLSDPTAYVSGGVLAAGGGILAVKVINIQTSNNMVVSYDPVTGNVTWNRNGCAAVIEI